MRNRPRSFAIICKRSRRVGHAGESKIVAKRRTVVTFYVSYYNSVRSHRARGGRGRETQNCRHSSFGLVSSLFGLFASQKCQQSRGVGGVVVAKCRIVVTFGLVRLVPGLRVSKVSTVTGIGVEQSWKMPHLMQKFQMCCWAWAPELWSEHYLWLINFQMYSTRRQVADRVD